MIFKTLKHFHYYYDFNPTLKSAILEYYLYLYDIIYIIKHKCTYFYNLLTINIIECKVDILYPP